MINYLSKFSPSTADVCESLETADIKQCRMDLECNIPETILKDEIYNKGRCMCEIL